MHDAQPPTRRYEEPTPITQGDAEAALASGDPARMGMALLRASLSDVDPAWVQAASLHHAAHPEVAVRHLALLALAHVARRYRWLDTEAVLAAVRSLTSSMIYASFFRNSGVKPPGRSAAQRHEPAAAHSMLLRGRSALYSISIASY